LQDGKIKQFPKVTDIDFEMMRKKEEFIYLHLENENQENVKCRKAMTERGMNRQNEN
jgi:hypothetical protein